MAMWRFAIKYMTHVSGAAENSMLSIVISYAGNIFFRFTVRRTRVTATSRKEALAEAMQQGYLYLLHASRLRTKFFEHVLLAGFCMNHRFAD